MPTIKIEGPSERLIHPPTGLRLGRDFVSEPPHLWINSGLSPADTRKLEAYKPVEVTETEKEVLLNAGITIEEVS